ncbi:hypothetical protein [Rhizobium sp. BK176]|uniref:hypothetical protein n=1 Tax=Rhizobium sp. BK176 TaxID=2587071 RepID=UPI00216760F0|nr:hypothetical protein [Rhizobium sp. BK176]MCS4089101.1 hypothetical protein [Rhizobium sp. BK176]
MSDFLPEDITDTAATPEGRVFAACVALARKGTPNEFPLQVDELVTAACVPANGAQPRLVTKRLSFEVPIQVASDRHFALHEQKIEHEGDGSSACTEVRDIWVDGPRAWEKTEQHHKSQKDPMAYLRLLAVQWASRALEKALQRSDTARAFDGIPDTVRNALWRISFQVDGSDAMMTRQLSAIPRLAIKPSAVWGAKTFLNIAAVDGKISDDDWKGHLLSFQLADIAEAQAVRDALVVRHCPGYDDTVSYDWMDVGVLSVGAGPIKAIRQEEEESSVVKGLRALGKALKNVGLMDQDDKGDFEVADVEGGPYQRLFREVIEAVSQKKPSGFRDFLKSEGWEFDFSPLDVANARDSLEAKATNERRPKP